MATYANILELINDNLVSGSKIQAVKHREVEIALLNYIQENLSQSGDIKAIKCDLAYLNSNFEVNGLGKNLRSGWAICNGNNGTDNIAGRTIIGQGIGYSTLSGTGGSKDAVVVAHSHKIGDQSGSSGSGTTNVRFIGKEIESNSTGIPVTDVEGVSGIDKNMQPYIILVYIMKL
jgi:hypothetical protein